MRKLFIISLIILCFSIVANAQDAQCPSGMVCISPEAAKAAVVAHETVKAQAAEILTLREAVIKQKEITADVKIELAKAIGNLTGSQQEAVSQRAIIEFLLKNGRKRCAPFAICF